MAGERRNEDFIEVSAADLERVQALATLGGLAAGLVHELNNPAAALSRTTTRLQNVVEDWQETSVDLAAIDLSKEARDSVLAQVRRIAGRESPDSPAGPLERSEAESNIAGWLMRKGIQDDANVAGTLGDSGLSVDDLELLTSELQGHNAETVVRWFAAGQLSIQLLNELQVSAATISEILRAARTQVRGEILAKEGKREPLASNIEKALTLMKHKIGDVGVEREFGGGVGEAPVPAEFIQVWTNLIDNAVDAMDGDGVLSISATRDDTELNIVFRDTGSGIPGSFQARVFEPFATSKEKGDGTGLGLHVSREIVRRRNGDIVFESDSNGTAFTVSVPIASGRSI